ncbi:MAG: 3-methyl-2-oxobutanoate hydroxymethyltransferase, partial [Burkholderiaceae bacterium]
MAGYLQDAPAGARTKAVTVTALQAMAGKGGAAVEKTEKAEKIAMLTCYDASFAALMDRCGVDVLLVGDSLGMVCQGHASTLPVTVADIAYHTASVARGNRSALLVADMPFGSHATPEA